MLKDRRLYLVQQAAMDGISGRLHLSFLSSLMELELESSRTLYFMQQLEDRSLEPRAIDTIKGL